MNLFCDVDWICINLHEVEVLWNLKFHAFSQILMIFAKSWIFAFFHMGEVKNWPPKNQPQDVGLEHFYNFVFVEKWRKMVLWKLHFFNFDRSVLGCIGSKFFESKTIWLANSTRSNRIWKKKKNWFFFDFSSKFLRIISQRNRHGSGRALAHFFVGVCRWDLPIFSSIGDYGGESVCNRYNRKI